MNRQVNENIDIHTDAAGSWYRCRRCQHVLSPSSEDWKQGTRARRLTPKSEPVVSDLVGPYWYLQLSCPSCGTLLDTSVVTKEE
jgi:hypothetical protein